MGEHGCRDVALSVPSVVGPSGVQQRIREKWASEEYLGFFDAIEKVRNTLEKSGDVLENGGKKSMSYFVHESSYVDEDVVIGDDTKIWLFCHIQSGVRIGKNCSMGQNVNVSNNVTIGDNCRIQNNVSIYEGVTLEDDVFCGPSCVFTNDLTPRATYPKGHENYGKTIVGKGASIGANATIVCGHNLGNYSMVAAGAVVTKDVPEYALVAGVPAKVIAYVNEQGDIVKRVKE